MGAPVGLACIVRPSTRRRDRGEISMNKSKILSSCVAAALLVPALSFAQDKKVDPAFPAYKAVQGVSGAIKSVGSNTMNQLMLNWGQSFKSTYPNVTLE